MKSPQEFKMDVYEKKRARLRLRSRRRRVALVCIPLALLVTAAGVFGPGLLREGLRNRTGRSGIPLALQVGTPAQVQKVTYEYYQELADAYGDRWYEIDQEERNAVEAQFEQAVTDNQRIDEAFQTAINDFSRDMAGALSPSFQENDCYSPLSLYYALALAGTGARGATQQEFAEVLHVPDLDWAAEQCARYYRQHSHQEDRSTFLLANSLWMDGRAVFDTEFTAAAEEKFYSALFQADLQDPAVTGEMTRWVSDNTGGLLKPEFEFSRDAMLDLLNTVYFRARWGDEFGPSLNTREDFTKLDGSTVTAEYMHQTSEYGSAYLGDGFTRAARYLSGGFQMIFILPDEGVDPASLLQDPDAFEKMFFPLEEEETFSCKVKWSVPKFSFDSNFDLKDPLQALGLSLAFDPKPRQADFSGMYTELPAEYSGLYLSQARQGVHIGIDEEGVEAAAYTELGMDGAGAALPPPDEIEMNLNRPFLFAIATNSDELDKPVQESIYNSGHSLLFVGVCGRPDC